MKNLTSYITGLLLMVAVLTGCKTAPAPLPYNTIIPPLPENTFTLGGPSPHPQTNLFAVQLAWEPSIETNINIVGYALYCGSNQPALTYSLRFPTTTNLNYFGTNCTAFVDRLSPTNVYRFSVTTRATFANIAGEVESDLFRTNEVMVPVPYTNILTVTETPVIFTNNNWISLNTNLSVKIINPADMNFYRGLIGVASWDTNSTVTLNVGLQQSTNLIAWIPGPWSLNLTLQEVPANAQFSSILDLTRWNNQNYRKTTNGVPSTIPIFVLK